MKPLGAHNACYHIGIKSFYVGLIGIPNSQIFFSCGGASIFSWLFSVSLVSSIAYIIGWKIGLSQLFVSAALTTIIVTVVSCDIFPVRRAFVVSALIIVCTAATIALLSSVAAGTYEIGRDGQTFHYAGIKALTDGWNPVQTRWKGCAETTDPCFDWHQLYPKITWYIAAQIGQIVDFDGTRFLNAIAIFGALLLSIGAIVQLNWLVPWQAMVVALAAAAHPVVASQFISSYQDGFLAASVIAAGAVTLRLLKDGRRSSGAILAIVVAVGINAKLTGVFFVGTAIMGLLLIFVFEARAPWYGARQVLVAATAGGLIGALVIGYSPYVASTLQYSNPFYPIGERNWRDSKGQSFEDSLLLGIPEAWKQDSSATQFLLSSFSEMYQSQYYNLKYPFTVTSQDWAAARFVDSRIAGFGPLFSAALLLSALAFPLAIILARASRQVLIGAGAVLLLLLTVLLNPVSFYARYVITAPLVPLGVAVLLFFATNAMSPQEGARWGLSRHVSFASQALAGMICAALIMNFFILIVGHFAGLNAFKTEMDSYFRVLRQEPSPIKGFSPGFLGHLYDG